MTKQFSQLPSMVRKIIKQQCTVIINLLFIRAYQFPMFCTLPQTGGKYCHDSDLVSPGKWIYYVQ